VDNSFQIIKEFIDKMEHPDTGIQIIKFEVGCSCEGIKATYTQMELIGTGYQKSNHTVEYIRPIVKEPEPKVEYPQSGIKITNPEVERFTKSIKEPYYQVGYIKESFSEPTVAVGRTKQQTTRNSKYKKRRKQRATKWVHQRSLLENKERTKKENIEA